MVDFSPGELARFQKVITDFLHVILKIVGHTGDELDESVQELQNFIFTTALSYALMKKPKEERDQLLAQIKTVTTPQGMGEVLSGQFTFEQMEASFKEAATDVLESYFQEITAELTQDQKNQLINFAQQVKELKFS
ncbi:MAG TPA: hypothetical protein VD999_06025 [Vitreimonas sp.]|nr:hypothetical protein [Vitreimonas sp.]